MSPSTITPAVGIRTLSARSRPMSPVCPSRMLRSREAGWNRGCVRQVYLPDGSARHICGFAAYGAHAGSSRARDEQGRRPTHRLGRRSPAVAPSTFRNTVPQTSPRGPGASPTSGAGQLRQSERGPEQATPARPHQPKKSPSAPAPRDHQSESGPKAPFKRGGVVYLTFDDDRSLHTGHPEHPARHALHSHLLRARLPPSPISG